MTTRNMELPPGKAKTHLSAPSTDQCLDTLCLSALVRKSYLEEVQTGLKNAALASARAACSEAVGRVRITTCYLHSSVAMISALWQGLEAIKFKIFPPRGGLSQLRLLMALLASICAIITARGS